MGKVYLLDCTLRDGGYINDWCFGEDAIRGFGRKIAQTGIEMYEVGFIKGDKYQKDRSVFPDISSFKKVILPKQDNLMYVGMLDMSAPVPKDRIIPYDGTSIDGIRVIFKKDKIQEAYDYCQYIKRQGYALFVQCVGTDSYSDSEFVQTIERFNQLFPYAFSIVDSFGLIKRKDFLRLCYLADHNLKEGITLGYHAHNNLQLAMGNAEALVELNLKRDVCIDACVFGMGRGAGNLNLELFAEYMNDNYNAHYRIEPMLEIMDEYLNDIYKDKFWGYSLPLYLSAANGCHPNYAIYLAEKDSLTEKAFNELLKSIPEKERRNFSRETAEKYYRKYQESFLDDKQVLEKLEKEFSGRNVLLLAPGNSILNYKEKIQTLVDSVSPLILDVNHINHIFQADYIFSSNMRRYIKIQGKTDAKCIITSNMKDAVSYDYMVHFASYASEVPEIRENSGIMALKLLLAAGVKKVYVAGMDGYSYTQQKENYVDENLEYDFSKEVDIRNQTIAEEIAKLKKNLQIIFITPSLYDDLR